MKAIEPSTSRIQLAWVGLLAAVTLIASVGFFYLQSVTAAARKVATDNLSAVADSKVGELVQWRRERMADGGILFKNAALSALVRRVLEKPADADAQRELQVWFGKYAAHYRYDEVRLLDTQGVTRLSAPAGLPEVTAEVVEHASEARRSGQVTLQDFYRSSHDQQIRLAVLIPILDESDANRTLGVIVLRIDPDKYLHPLIKRWPTPSATAETLPVRRDGNDVLYLNDLRHRTNSALVLRLPLTRTNLLAVRAVFGQTGIMSGVDYRGVPALGIGRAVPDSPWFMIAKIDLAEINAPLRQQTLLISVSIGLLLLVIALGAGLFWRQQRVRHYREQAETAEALRASEGRLDFALQTIRTGAWELDLVNQTGQRTLIHDQIFGYATLLPQWTFEIFLEHVLPEDRPGVDRSFREATTKQNDWNFECRIRRADGDVRWIFAAGSHRHDAEGKPVRMSGIVQDITERKQVEEKLRLAGIYNRSLLEASLDPLVTISIEGKITDVNAATETATGRGRAELIGTDFSDYFTDPAKARAGYQQVFREGFVRDYELELRRGINQTTPVLYNATVYRTEQGEVLGVFAAARDITERKQMEAALNEISVALQDKNAELERFLYTASHDLKSPVVTVRTFLGYLEQDLPKGDAGRIASDLNFIRIATEKMARLLDDLLEMSRVGRVVGPPVRVTFRQLVDDALAAVAGQIAQRGVTVTVGDGAATVFGDRVRLAEVLQNLLDNACKFMGEQKAPRIEVGFEVRGAETVFFVRDNGIGIDPRFQAKVFGLFEKLDTKAAGSGIGLALVKRIVELHGGRIWVESAGLGSGAGFYFTLPEAVGTGDRIQNSEFRRQKTAAKKEN